MVNNTISKYPVYSTVQHVSLGNMLPRSQFPHTVVTVPTWSTSTVEKEKEVERNVNGRKSNVQYFSQQLGHSIE